MLSCGAPTRHAGGLAGFDNDAVNAAEGDGGLGAIGGQRPESLSLSAGEHQQIAGRQQHRVADIEIVGAADRKLPGRSAADQEAVDVALRVAVDVLQLLDLGATGQELAAAKPESETYDKEAVKKLDQARAQLEVGGEALDVLWAPTPVRAGIRKNCCAAALR